VSSPSPSPSSSHSAGCPPSASASTARADSPQPASNAARLDADGACTLLLQRCCAQGGALLVALVQTAEGGQWCPVARLTASLVCSSPSCRALPTVPAAAARCGGESSALPTVWSTVCSAGCCCSAVACCCCPCGCCGQGCKPMHCAGTPGTPGTSSRRTPAPAVDALSVPASPAAPAEAAAALPPCRGANTRARASGLPGHDITAAAAARSASGCCSQALLPPGPLPRGDAQGEAQNGVARPPG
jgi:hypothetical protein